MIGFGLVQAWPALRTLIALLSSQFVFKPALVMLNSLQSPLQLRYFFGVARMAVVNFKLLAPLFEVIELLLAFIERLGEFRLKFLHLRNENLLVFEPFLEDARFFLLTSKFVFQQGLGLLVSNVAGTILGLE